jgi:hypothetical protein
MIQNVPNQPLGIRQRVPLLGQQQPNPDQMARMQIMQAMNDMAVGMYVQLAVAHVATRDAALEQDIDVEYLRPLAKKCRTAAMAFFEGLGIIESPARCKQDEENEPRND